MYRLSNRMTFPFPYVCPRAVGGGIPPTLAFRSSTTSTSTLINKPAGAIAGDVLIIANVGYNSASSVPPVAVTPLGFTVLTNDNRTNGTLAIRVMLSWKILDGSEASSFTGMSAASNSIVCMCFSGGVATISPSTGLSEIALSTTPSNQLIASSASPNPVIAIAIVGGSTSGGQSGTMTPSAGGSITSLGRLGCYYKIYNSSPSDITAASTQTGTLRCLQSGYLSAS